MNMKNPGTVNFADCSNPHTGILAAKGFARDGNKQGGIDRPTAITIPSGAILIRLYDTQKDHDGRWWVTPSELRLIMAHAGHDSLDVGRGVGESLLHKAFAVLGDWQSMTQFRLSIFKANFSAYYGEGAAAVDSNRKNSRNVEPLRLMDSKGQFFPRQIFIPNFNVYRQHVNDLKTGYTDTDLAVLLRSQSAQFFGFEIRR